MNRWLVLPIGLGLAVAAGWVLLSGPSGESLEQSLQREKSLQLEKSLHAHAEIDPESREQLREILRRADEDGR